MQPQSEPANQQNKKFIHKESIKILMEGLACQPFNPNTITFKYRYKVVFAQV